MLEGYEGEVFGLVAILLMIFALFFVWLWRVGLFLVSGQFERISPKLTYGIEENVEA